MELKKYYNYNQLKQILWNVRTSAQFFCMKNGAVYSHTAELYLDALNEYTKYLIPEMIEDFKNNTKKLIYSPFIPQKGAEISTDVQKIMDRKDDFIIDNLYSIMNALEIMKVYDDTNSWEEVDKVIHNQRHSSYTFTHLMNIMIIYSKIGVLFVDRYGSSRLKIDKNFKAIYEKAFNYQLNKTKINEQIVLTLKRRLAK